MAQVEGSGTGMAGEVMVTKPPPDSTPAKRMGFDARLDRYEPPPPPPLPLLPPPVLSGFPRPFRWRAPGCPSNRLRYVQRRCLGGVEGVSRAT
jgi:hypothetical protein